MVSPAREVPGAVLGWVKANIGSILREAGVNFVLPFAIFSLAQPRTGDVVALMAASTPPVLWSLFEFLRVRRLDAISLLVLSGIGLSVLAYAGGGGARVLQLRESLVAGLVGLVFLLSAAIRRPLILQLSRAGVRRRSADQVDAFEGLIEDARFRRCLTRATLVWGVGLVGVCVANSILVFLVSIRVYLLVSGPLSYAVIGALTAWTFLNVGREKRNAEARRAARADGGESDDPDLTGTP